ncbi:MAG: RNA polymerase sigma factor [Planctomycetes bacterium]|nr:RNA polymerase sigma factor [Planctomycetota bacterium]
MEMEQEKAQSGRISTLEVLYAQHGPHILRYLQRFVGPKHAEDVLQDTFVQALWHFERLCDVSVPRAWLFRVARNLAMNVLRKNKMATNIDLDGLIHSTSLEDSKLTTMRQAIKKLPEKHRETIMLRWYDQLSYEEIAQVLNISIGTVRSRLHYALGQLRTQMEVELAVDP